MVHIYVEDMQISDGDLIASKLSNHSLQAEILSDQKVVRCRVSDAEEIMDILHNVGLTPSI